MKTLSTLMMICIVCFLVWGCNGRRGGQDISKTNNVVAMAAPAFAGCDTSTEQNLDYGFDVDNPNNVYLFEHHELDTSYANFKKIFFLANNDILINPVDSLTLGNICSLLQLIQSDAAINFNPKSDFSALRLTYGLDHQSMVIIFEPVALRHTNGDSNTYDILSTRKHFRLVNNVLDPLSINDSISLVQQYITKIRIHHFDPLTPQTTFVDTDDFRRGDTHYTIMPIKQILQMYYQNKPGNVPNVIDTILFSIVANNFFKVNDTNIPNYKLHIIAYTRKISDGTSNTNFVNNGADFTQMCPPNCGTVKLNYYKWCDCKPNSVTKTRTKTVIESQPK